MVIFGIRKRVKELEEIVKIQQKTINQLLINQEKVSIIVSRLVDKAETELVEETGRRLGRGVVLPKEESPIIVNDPLTKKEKETKGE